THFASIQARNVAPSPASNFLRSLGLSTFRDREPETLSRLPRIERSEFSFPKDTSDSPIRVRGNAGYSGGLNERFSRSKIAVSRSSLDSLWSATRRPVHNNVAAWAAPADTKYATRIIAPIRTARLPFGSR